MEIKKVKRYYNTAAGDPFCFDDCVSTFTNYHGADSRIAYIQSLRLPFGKDGINYGKEVGDIQNALEKFCGIHIENIYESDDWLKTVLEYINEDYICSISIKGYCCPWDWRFSEPDLEGEHSFFILGSDISQKVFNCIDPYYNQSVAVLPFDLFSEGCTRVSLYKYDYTEWNNDDLVCALKEETDYLKNNQPTFESVEKMLSDYFAQKDLGGCEPSKRRTYVDVNSDYVYILLEFLALERVKFAWYADSLNERGILHSNSFSDEFADISKLWNSIKKNYAKNLLRGKVDVSGISEKICETIILELGLLDRMLADIAVDSWISVEQKKTTEIYTNLESVNLDIRTFFNNTGVCHNGNEADFNGFGNYFIEESLILEDKKTFGDVSFVLNRNEDGNDNIICKKQSINCDVGKCRSIHFLACSDWEDSKIIVGLKYNDGSVERKLLEVEEWVPPQNKDLKNVCIKALKSVRKSAEKTEPCYVYAYAMACDCNKELLAVELPDCDSIHIFAVTVGIEK